MLYFPPELKSIERTIEFDSDPTSPTITDLHDVAKITTFDGIELSKKEDGTFIYEEEKGLFEIQFIKLKDSEFRIRLSSKTFKELLSQLAKFINLVTKYRRQVDTIEDDLKKHRKKWGDVVDDTSNSAKRNKETWGKTEEILKSNLRRPKGLLTKALTQTEKTTQQLNDLIKKISTDIKKMKFENPYGDLIMELTLQFKPPLLPQEVKE